MTDSVNNKLAGAFNARRQSRERRGRFATVSRLHFIERKNDMQLEDFLKMTPEEQTAFLTSAADAQRTIEELTAERDSLRTENDTFTQQLAANNEELKKTKELNYTLARQISREPAIDEDAEITKILKGDY